MTGHIPRDLFDRFKGRWDADPDELKEEIREWARGQTPGYQEARRNAEDALNKYQNDRRQGRSTKDSRADYDFARRVLGEWDERIGRNVDAAYAQIKKVGEKQKPLSEIRDYFEEVIETPTASPSYQRALDYLMHFGATDVSKTYLFDKLTKALVHRRLDKKMRGGLEEVYNEIRQADSVGSLTNLKAVADIEKGAAAAELQKLIKDGNTILSGVGFFPMLFGHRFRRTQLLEHDWGSEEEFTQRFRAALAQGDPDLAGRYAQRVTAIREENEFAASTYDIESVVNRYKRWVGFYGRVANKAAQAREWIESPESVENIGGVLRKIIKWTVLKPLDWATLAYTSRYGEIAPTVIGDITGQPKKNGGAAASS